MILDKDSEIIQREDRIAKEIADEIQSGIKKRKEIIDQIKKELEVSKREDLRRIENELMNKLTTERDRKTKE